MIEIRTHYSSNPHSGYVENDEINEASGLGRSITNPGVMYTHNDSGGTARVFAITEQGTQIGKSHRFVSQYFLYYAHVNRSI